MNGSLIKLCVTKATIFTFILMIITQPIIAKPAIDSDMLDEALQSFRPLRGAAIDSYIQLAVGSQQYWANLDVIDQFTTKFILQPSKAYAMEGSGLVGVFLPISGGAGYSNLQIWFDETNHEIVSTMMFVFEQRSNDEISANLFIDGQVQMTALVSIAGDILGGELYSDKGVATNLLDVVDTQKSWSCMNSCLAGLGVPNWILAVMAVACAAICVGTAGLGCLACLSALSFGLGFELGWCIGACF